MNPNAEVEDSSSETDSSEDERRRRKGKQRCPSRSNDIKNYNTIDPGFFEDKDLYELFRENKTKISIIEEPTMFLRHLKDHRLITDELYKKLENGADDNALYDALEYIQIRGKKKVRTFWECVLQEHILQRYSQLSEIAATLKNFLVFNSSALENEPSKKPQARSEDGGTGKEREVKKRRTEGYSVSNQAGPSSQSTNSQRKTFGHVKKGSLKNALKNEPRERSEDGGTEKEREGKKRRTEGNSMSNQAGPSSQSTKCQWKTSEYVEREEEKDLWDKHKRWLPVTCGGKEALLDREVLRRYGRKNQKCIKYHKNMIAPYQFEEMAGKEKNKNWKISILCQGKTIKDLLKNGILEMPEKKKNYLP